MNITKIAYIVAGITWGMVALLIVAMIITSIIRRFKNGDNNYRLTGTRHIDMCEEDENSEKD